MRLGALYCKGARAGDRMSSGGLAFVLISLLYSFLRWTGRNEKRGTIGRRLFGKHDK